MLVLPILAVLTPTVFAQNGVNLSAGVAVSINVSDTNVKDGDIVSSSPSGYKLAKIAYDPATAGVISDSPALDVQDTIRTPSTREIITYGNAYVLVSTINGPIEKNDYISTSTIPGVGQKASANGFVLGVAQQSYNNPNQTATGKILVNISPHYNATFFATQTNLLENLKAAIASPFMSPITTFRYVLAGIVALLSFILGFIYFGRVIKTGVEALGRNPLAERAIIISIIFNLITTIIIMLIGFGISYLILIL